MFRHSWAGSHVDVQVRTLMATQIPPLVATSKSPTLSAVRWRSEPRYFTVLVSTRQDVTFTPVHPKPAKLSLCQRLSKRRIYQHCRAWTVACHQAPTSRPDWMVSRPKWANHTSPDIRYCSNSWMILKTSKMYRSIPKTRTALSLQTIDLLE